MKLSAIKRTIKDKQNKRNIAKSINLMVLNNEIVHEESDMSNFRKNYLKKLKDEFQEQQRKVNLKSLKKFYKINSKRNKES